MHLDLTNEQTNLVLQSLAAQPYQAVAPLIAEIQKQAQQQQAADAAPTTEEQANA